MKFTNTTRYERYDTAELRAVFRAAVSKRSPSWRRRHLSGLAVTVAWSRRAGHRGGLHATYAEAHACANAERFAWAKSEMGRLGGCPPDDGCMHCPAPMADPRVRCAAWRATIDTSVALVEYLGGYRGDVERRSIVLRVPGTSLDAGMFAALVIDALDLRERGHHVRFEPRRPLSWVVPLAGVAEELFPVEPRPPTAEERAAERRAEREERIRRLEAREKQWTSKKRRAETALAKIGRELKRLRRVEVE